MKNPYTNDAPPLYQVRFRTSRQSRKACGRKRGIARQTHRRNADRLRPRFAQTI